MKLALFDTRSYDREAFQEANEHAGHALTFFDPRLTRATAALATDFSAVCAFVNDSLDAEVLTALRRGGTTLLALRSAGFNHVDLGAAERLGIAVTRVPDYSPEAVAEHAVALLLTLNRKTHRAYARVRELNFSLEGLVGFNLCGKAVGIVGTGKIGAAAARIFLGFGCRVIAWDVVPSPSLVEAGVTYVELDALLAQSDVVSLHLPLSPQTRHLIDGDAVGRMKRGAVLINTGRGGLVDTQALLEGLKSGKLGGAGLDVYEAEAGVFFNDLSTRGLEDDALARLLTLPNVLITSHQAFLTREALGTIARTTLEAVSAFERGEPLVHRVRPDPVPIAPPRP